MSAYDEIKHLFPCSEARIWARNQPSLSEAWKVCTNGSWMLWLIGKTTNCPRWSDGRKPLLACALDCAETVKHFWSKSLADQIGNAVQVLRNWINGGPVEEAKEARRQLYSAYATAADDAAATAAYAAAAAADDAAATAYAAAATAAYAAAAYAAAAYAAASRKEVLAQCADIVRRHFPDPPDVGDLNAASS